MKRYAIVEVFYSLQGEGHRTGEPSLFVRFAGCNMACSMMPGPKSPGGFDCDTDFAPRRQMTAQEIVEECASLSRSCGWVVLTGGEPLLQYDAELSTALFQAGYKVAIETNGTVPLSKALACDWLTVSPKVAEADLMVTHADEVKYVCWPGMALPKPTVHAAHLFLQPAWRDDPKAATAHAIELCLEHPAWRLSSQQHKAWGVR